MASRRWWLVVVPLSYLAQGCGDDGTSKVVDAPAALNLGGTWEGRYATSLLDTTRLALELDQLEKALTGLFFTASAANGRFQGEIGPDGIEFALDETTEGCPGSFSGTAVATDDSITFQLTGSDCLGRHANGMGVLWRQHEEPGNALSLDGADDVAQASRSIYPDGADLRSFTVEAWIYPLRTGRFVVTDDAYDLEVFYDPRAANGGLGVEATLWAADCGSFTATTEYRNVVLNQWNHVAILFDASTRRLWMSINGVVSAEPTAVDWEALCFDSDQQFSVGGGYEDRPFAGRIDDVRVSDQPLYRVDFTPARSLNPDPSTRGLWHFDESAGSILYSDATGRGGRLVGLFGAHTASRD